MVPLTLPHAPATDCVDLAERVSPAGTVERAHRLLHVLAPVRFWHLASLDAPTVAAVWSLGFAWVARVRLPLWVLALQVLVVWTVYVGDRLLDARVGLRRGNPKSPNGLMERHFFHWRHRRILAPLALVSAGAAACIALRWMPVGARERDSVLAAASLAYFTRVHAGSMRARSIVSKELLVGLLFTAGCAMPAWSRADWRPLVVPVVLFAALGWLNCRAIEQWETGQPGVAHAARWTTCGGIIAAAAVAFAEPRGAALLAAAAFSALLLAGLDGLRQRMAPVTLRAAADLVLLTPALLMVRVGR